MSWPHATSLLAVLILGGQAFGADTQTKQPGAAPSRAAPSSDAAAVDRCQSQERHGHRSEAQACFRTLVRSTSPYLRAEGYWGLHEYEQANEEFRAAVSQ